MIVWVSLDILCHATEGETVNCIQLKSHGELIQNILELLKYLCVKCISTIDPCPLIRL
jgi:hypothetical protein